MKHLLETQVEINASSEKIWEVLTNFSAYPEWNPFITSIEGDLNEGSRLKANIGGMKFAPKVIELIPGKKLKWLGKLYIVGLFDGEHQFEIIELENGHCQFLHSEKFNGILVGMFKKKLDTDTLEGFKGMNQALKERCEQS